MTEMDFNRIAVHEAGHALVALHCDFNVEVEIYPEPEDDTYAMTHIDGYDTGLEDQIMRAMAGPLAERRAFDPGETLENLLHDGFHSDVADLPDDWWDYEAAVEEWLDSNWDDLLALAAQLQYGRQRVTLMDDGQILVETLVTA